MFRFKTYPEEGKLAENSNVQIRVTGLRSSSQRVVYHMAEDGTIEEMPAEITNYGAFTFQTSKLGYYAVGKGAAIHPSPTTMPTEQTVITETPLVVPTEPVSTTAPGKKTAPKTADKSDRAAAMIITLMSVSVLSGLVFVKRKNKIE